MGRDKTLGYGQKLETEKSDFECLPLAAVFSQGSLNPRNESGNSVEAFGIDFNFIDQPLVFRVTYLYTIHPMNGPHQSHDRWDSFTGYINLVTRDDFLSKHQASHTNESIR